MYKIVSISNQLDLGAKEKISSEQVLKAPQPKSSYF